MRSPLNRLSPADYISALNGLSGFLAISFLLNREMVAGSLMIAMAVLFDGLDGIVARKYGGPHDRGMQVDSIADTISFCAAPGLAIYASYHTDSFSALSAASIMVSLLYVFLGIVRLSAFSREGHRLSYFRGLPTPSAALMAISAMLITGYGGAYSLPWFGLLVSVLVSLLMVAPLPYPKPRHRLAYASASVLLLFIFLLAISVFTGYISALVGSAVLLLSTSLYVALGPVYMKKHPSPKTI